MKVFAGKGAFNPHPPMEPERLAEARHVLSRTRAGDTRRTKHGKPKVSLCKSISDLKKKP